MSAGVRLVSSADVESALTPEEAILAQRDAFAQLARGQARVLPRAVLATAGGTTLFMPGYLEGSATLGLKAVSVIPGNAARGRPTVPATVLLLDGETGAPRAVLEATLLTAVRTAAGSALAADHLAAPGARVLTVFGAGSQARQHIRMLRAVRPIEIVRIVARHPDHARTLAAALVGVEARAVVDPRTAVEGADLVVTATNSPVPVFPGDALGEGCHVTAVGAYTPETREVDDDVVRRARIVVDTREGALEEAGDLLLPRASGVLPPDFIDADLGELVIGSKPDGAGGRALTLYKSVGTAAQDLATAERVVRLAEERGLGTVVRL